MRTYLLFEIANSHGGSKDYVYKLIDALPQGKNTRLRQGFGGQAGIKFQVFKYDQLALKDYEWYKVYVKLFFDKASWKKILLYTKGKGFDIWIDVFDLYSVEVLKDNLNLVTGIKLQSSVLDNLRVLKGLSEVIRGKKIKVILNVAGREIDNIKEILTDIRAGYFSNEIMLQCGFQAYPTDAEDLTIHKIHVLKSEFPDLVVSYADHVDGKSPLAFDVPVFAVLAGAGHIEKHVCLDRKKTKYDFQSAVEPHELTLLLYKLKECEKILGTKLISEKEANYLKTTIEKPITSVDIRARDVINLKNFDFRRTSQEGLTVGELKEMMKKRYVFSKDVKTGQTIKKSSLKKARIGVLIACRMKSTRLKHKAVLPIGKFSSIERCIINAKKIKSADEIILATSALAEDQILKKYALKHKIRFFAGDPEDVIARFLGATEKYNLDIAIRVTGDCPIVSYEMAEFILQRHFEKGNDYTGPKAFAVGQNSEIYSVNTLKRVLEYLGDARHSEYMTWYMLTNKDIFQVDMAELPKEWVRNYRLTLDVQEDLDMFNALFEKLGIKEPSIKNVFDVIDKNPRIHELNDAIGLKYKTDQKLIDLLTRETKINPPRPKRL
ncbi:MAG: hypothetical protein A3F98_02290 [Candidatus Yanofskybacteria bacterium RIFCSPLOWO2_12_FULL_41_8]|uniref:PseI/NeuA/B-like domain-containing protein n=1 Tax=Candidatus Yanofskybacteria bacterium RIFCSPHIGHO2_01_FULL_41_53 TaxID=1802663 RepID=A0A1F8EJ52_9BACT|nr:MAG: hypothetical protein A2650_02020 [Candidatus Yanofskybacteria bacterium RIFCSPHIGHO2_01_FULL_41_53]OGN30439.1 MAG: hypothetical protein A3H54_00205 [Candidatus Yanofskybacteria bacterium RIFCSPLOWO2_02_FULL_41_13]OGN33126.1 MAG: hypothetical protein A3F98_02290 [Candidatus Yanofskybacteria bacterium RIFCSPLOWO2_12_FULL_41_8]